jgi:2-oxoisovalerate dehydrogenase E1 component
VREQPLRHRDRAILGTLNPEIATRAAAYGIPGIAVDGNDVVAVWQATQEA